MPTINKIYYYILPGDEAFAHFVFLKTKYKPFALENILKLNSLHVKFK